MIYEVVEEPRLTSPVMVSALSGWVDAASAGSTAAEHLAGEGDIMCTFDGDALFDYRSQRPVLDIVDGVMAHTEWPKITVRHSVVGERDLLVITGSEPDLAWRAFASAVAEIAHRFDVTQLVTLGSVPAAVPHTLPSPVMTTASDMSLITHDVRPPEGLLRVPAAAVSMVDQQVAASGIPTVGFFVQVPHYASGNYPAAVLALLQRFSRHLGLDMPLTSFEEEARVHRTQLDELVSSQPEAQEHIKALEKMSAENTVLSGEDLAVEIEKYLKDAAPDDRRPFDEGS
jgi:proteasome assembly chaperone (PAC2) family protein